MRSVDDLIIDVLLVVVIGLGAWYGAHHYGAVRYDAGYAAAVAAGQAQRDAEVLAASAIESGLRTKLLQQDTEQLKKDQEHAQAIADAQRRMRAGTDRLLCPAANPVHETTAAGTRPAPAEPGTDGARPAIVPETAADLLGIAGYVEGLVSRYQQVIDRFDTCRAVNAR